MDSFLWLIPVAIVTGAAFLVQWQFREDSGPRRLPVRVIPVRHNVDQERNRPAA